MSGLKQMFRDKPHAQGAIVIIAVLAEVIGVSLVALSFLMMPAMPIPSAHLNKDVAAILVLIAIVILFAVAVYFAGRLYGEAGIYTIAWFVAVLVGLLSMIGLSLV